MMAAFGTVADYQFSDVPRLNVIEELAVTPPMTVETGAIEYFLREERIQRGDTVAQLLTRLGVDDTQAIDFIRNNKNTQSIYRQLGPGKNIIARTGPSGELLNLVFPLNGGADAALVIDRNGSTFSASEQSLQLEKRVMFRSAEIRHSLFGATDAAGIPDSVATQLAEIFGGDIDFHRDLRKGDRISVVFETLNHFGRPVRTGRILAAEFINNGKAYRAAWFADPAGMPESGGYYTADGKSIRKAFLRSPLEFSRITSGFTLARFHPVLQTWRAHKGIDYGAPVGTRIRATADGVVESIGLLGGYGKTVVLRHQGRYTTLYAHMSSFPSALRKGGRVSQGDTIGFVGSTGLASGPHLHYEFRIDGQHQNPLAIALPDSKPLDPSQLASFRNQTGEHIARLDLIGSFDLTQSD